MNRFDGILCTSVAIAALTACGGGGDDPAPATRHTQDEVKAVAQLGVFTTTGSGLQAEVALGYLGGYLAGYSISSTGASAPATRVPCALFGGSGSFTVTVTKSAARTGLAAGDQILAVFSNCEATAGGLVVNGTVKLTAQGPVANPTLATYDLLYEADMSGFSIKQGSSAAATFTGVVNANSRLTDNNRTSQTFTVPAAKTLSISGAGFVATYRGGARFLGTETTSPHSATLKLDGEVDVTAASSSGRLIIATPTELSGSTTSGRFVPTSGTIETRTTSPSIATSMRLSGSNATISGDTDGNGTLDLVFDASWAALTTP